MREGNWDPMWGWVAAIIALAVVIVLVAGYYRHEPSTASRIPPAPTTTGAAPSARPLPPAPPPAATPPDQSTAPDVPQPAPLQPGAPPASGGSPPP
jgi:hypothetical protein